MLPDARDAVLVKQVRLGQAGIILTGCRRLATGFLAGDFGRGQHVAEVQKTLSGSEDPVVAAVYDEFSSSDVGGGIRDEESN